MIAEEMKAGAQLNALVAEKVMGWAKTTIGWMEPQFPGGPGFLKATNDWSPSTDIACAWEVVEKVGLGIRPVVAIGKPWRSVTAAGTTWGFHPATAWEVTHPIDCHIVLAKHEKPAMAVCLGALRAIELLKEWS